MRGDQYHDRFVSWLLLSLLATIAEAQIGTTTCVCAPSTYRMTFDFSQTCETTALRGDGIVTSDCAVAPFQDDSVTDLVPVTVGSIDVLELDENLVLLSQSSKFGTYQDGDSFDYESVSNNPSAVNVTSYPRALQVSVIGNNAAGETLFFAGLMVFVTDCSVFPNLVEGSSIGWVTFTVLTDPSSTVCPLVDASLPVGDASMSASQSKKAPTLRPSHAPVRAPSLAPARYPYHPTDDDCEYGKGKKKGKGKGERSSSGKGMGKGKGKKKGKGHNVFDHECYEKSSDRKHSSGKGEKKEKGELTYDDILDLLHSHPIPPTRGPVEAPSTLHPTVSSVRVDDSADPSADSSADFSTSDQQSGLADPRPFWGSASYYIVLTCSVILALIGACLMCYQPRWFLDDEASRQQRSILKHDDETWMTE